VVFSEEDKALIENLYLIKGRKRSRFYKLLARLRKTRTTKRMHGSVRTRTMRNEWRDQHI